MITFDIFASVPLKFIYAYIVLKVDIMYLLFIMFKKKHK